MLHRFVLAVLSLVLGMSPALASSGEWRLTAVDLVEARSKPGTTSTVGRGRATTRTVSPTSGDVFAASFVWQEPAASYAGGGLVRLSIAAKIDEYKWHGKRDGYLHLGINFASGHVTARIDQAGVNVGGVTRSAAYLETADRKSTPKVSVDDGRITTRSASATVEAAFQAGGREGDERAIYIASSAGMARYTYRWSSGEGGAAPPVTVASRPQTPLKPAAPEPRRAPCKEAGFFYDDKTLGAVYTGEPSLNVNGEQLVNGIIGAIQKYERDGGRATAGVRNLDAPFIAQAFDSGALPTGREQALREEATELAQRQGKLGPEDLFYCALKASGGNVRDALVACHAALYRDKDKVNAAFIEQSLQPIRNPNGYQAGKTVTVWNEQLKREEKVSPRDTCGNDQQGAWYHLFGMAALEFTDRHGMTPFLAVRMGAEWKKPVETAPLKQKGFPMSEVCGELSNYAVALENQVRSNMRRAPDPDKQCVNYFGASVGTALAKYMQLPTQPGMLAKVMNIETRRQFRTNMDYVWLMKSPLSITVRGTRGEELTFDQEAKTFGGNTDLAWVDPLIEDDGTWGLVVVPFFPVRDVQWTAVGSGPATIAVHDLKRGRTRGYGLTVQPSDTFKTTIVDGVPELQQADGSTLAPEADQPTTEAEIGDGTTADSAEAPSQGGEGAPPASEDGEAAGGTESRAAGGPSSGSAGSGFPLPLLLVAGVAAAGFGLVVVVLLLVGAVKVMGRASAPRVPEARPAPPDVRAVAHLDVRRPDGTWGQVPLTGERLTIGRDPSNALVLSEPEASRKHAEIGRTPDGIFVRDLGSHAGTWVNGARVTETWLQPGDRVQVSGVQLVVPGGE